MYDQLTERILDYIIFTAMMGDDRTEDFNVLVDRFIDGGLREHLKSNSMLLLAQWVTRNTHAK